jgi:hypothetical protein
MPVLAEVDKFSIATDLADALRLGEAESATSWSGDRQISPASVQVAPIRLDAVFIALWPELLLMFDRFPVRRFGSLA